MIKEKKDKHYNWWEDPVNKEEADKLSWWEHPENKTTIELPVSMIWDGKYWSIAGNSETERLFGKGLIQGACGKTKEKAIKEFFTLIKIVFEDYKNSSDKYEKWVPFIKGPWKHIGDQWFQVFGIHVYFRIGKGMQGGWYVPFTKLNISTNNLWRRKSFK